MFFKIIKVIVILLTTSAAQFQDNQDFSSLNNYPYHSPISPLKLGNEEQKSNSIRSIQVAPLKKQLGGIQLEKGWFSKLSAHRERDSGSYTHTVATDISAVNIEYRKQLDPQVEVKQGNVHSRKNLEYVPGHNIEVLRSVKRNTGYNGNDAKYKNYEGYSSLDKNSKLNYLKQYIIYSSGVSDGNAAEAANDRNVKNPDTTTTTPTTTTKSQQQTLSLNNYQFLNFNNQQFQQTPLSPKSPYTKLHTLLLNVARAYSLNSPPQLKPISTIVHPDSIPITFAKISPNAQNLVQGPGVVHVEGPTERKKFMAHPLYSNLNIAFHS